MKLNDDIELRNNRMVEFGGHYLTRKQVRTVFIGKATKIESPCSKCTESHTSTFSVVRNGDGLVTSIGCQTFTPEMVKKVRSWLRAKSPSKQARRTR